VGDWYLGPDGKWAYDRNAPSPGSYAASDLPLAEQVQRLPAVEPSAAVPVEQEDLSHLDESYGPLVNTEKLAPFDEVLFQPPQDPDWIPEDWS